ncbi:MAG: hypothetical protein JOZ38_03405 [Candidatus Eremiobacteraeota bacterium]|nr:hypothetical protein [Candidatus Eremiobacteraeota bacterium]
MIDANNPAIDVDELMTKVNLEVARRTVPGAAGLADAAISPDALVTAASVEAVLATAERKSQIRTDWPGRLNRFPFSLLMPLRYFFLRALAFIFKDQRHVNFALIEVARELSATNVRLQEQIDQLRARVNALDDRLPH